MSLPELVQSTLDDEPVAARVGLGGEDELLVTPTRTLVYRSEGLLSDESVTEYPHDAERVSVAEGRRKSKVTLDYGLDGEETFALPTKSLDEALHPVLAGVLNAAGITDAGETVKRTFRFSELTVVVTSARLVKHIGPVVWDDDYEEFHYADVTDLVFEEGNVATSVVLTLDDRQQRFKAPNEQARAVREALTDAVCAYHDVASLEELRAKNETDDEPARDTVAFGEGPDPLGANPAELTDGTDGTDGDASVEAVESSDGEATPTGTFEFGDAAAAGSSVAKTDATDADVAAELRELRATVEEQNERLARQEELIDQLIQELRQGR